MTRTFALVPEEKLSERSKRFLQEFHDVIDVGLLPFERKNLMEIDDRGALSFRDQKIPYELLPYFFKGACAVKTFGASPIDSTSFKETKFDVYAKGNKYSYLENADSTRQFLRDGKLHSLQGPAWVSQDGRSWKYYVNGRLHHTDGPAVVDLDSGQEEYALFGRKLDLEDFILGNPRSTTTVGARGKKTYSVTKWKNYAVVEGLDGTIALMKKVDEPPNVDNFLVELIARPMSGYHVIRYPQLGSFLDNVHLTASCGSPFWEIKSGTRNVEMSSLDDLTTFSFDRETKALTFQSNAYQSPVSFETDLSFRTVTPSSYGDYKPFLVTFIKKDELGRKHSAEGPAVLNPDGTTEYYIHGARFSKERFESKSWDEAEGAFCWRDKTGQLHSDSSLQPSQVFPTGEQRFHRHGKLHNGLLPAVFIPTPDFNMYRYYLYGNEVSAVEFSNYDPIREVIEFTDDNGILHKEDGPALIEFEADGSFTERYYRHGQLHHDSGPAIRSSDGGFEWRMNGRKHRLDGPAVWNPMKHRQEFYVLGRLHNNTGPAVIVNADTDEEYSEYWLSGKQYSHENLSNRKPKMRVNLARDFRDKSHGDHHQPEGEDTMSNTENTGRFGQVSDGLKSGVKRGTIRVASGKAAGALAKHMPMQDTLPMEQLTQLVLLVGGAELVERAPDGVASKIGLNEERRAAFGKMSRTLGGEMMGRNAVQLFSKLAPMLLENLNGISAEEINDVVSNFEVEEEVEMPALSL